MSDKDNLPIPYEDLIGTPNCPHAKMFIDKYFCEDSLIRNPDCNYLDTSFRLFACKCNDNRSSYCGCDYKRLLKDVVDEKLKQISLEKTKPSLDDKID